MSLPSAPTAGASVLDAIGHTPVVDVSTLLGTEAKRGVRLFAKLESANPTGSIKDRVAFSMISRAQRSGALRPGQTILEPTSGNTGISLALVARLFGHPMRAVMPDNATPERVQLLRLFGAQVISSPGAEGSNGAVRMAKRLAAEDTSLFVPMQYENPDNPRAHYDGTAVELLEQLEGKLDAFVAGLGTGGTLTGCGRRLREHSSAIKIIAAEPMPGDPVMGLRSLDEGYIPPVLDVSLLDRRILVRNGDAVRSMRDLTSVGVFAGVSSGAVLHVARKISRELPDGARVAMIVADSGWKYLSAGLWNRDLGELEQSMEHGQWW